MQMIKQIKKTIALLIAITLILPLALYGCAEAKKSNESSVLSSENASVDSEASESLDDSTNQSSEEDSSSEESSSQIPPSSSSSASNSNSSSSSNNNSTSSSDSSNKPTTPTTSSVKYIRCTGNNVNIRSGASTNHTVLGIAEKGTMYAVIEQKDGWYKTYYRNQTAYLYASYATVFTIEKSKNKSVENVIEEGYKLLGTPYVYGAVRLHDGKGNLLKNFSVKKFDCSSLMQYVFYKGAKTLLNTTTRTQVKQGKYVAKSEIRRGDLLFFTNEDRQYNTGIERVGHVALYLGDNYILHTASDYARIEKISAYRWNFYIEARRFF